MGVAEVPTKLGPDILIKTILPGLAVFIAFFEPVIYPLIKNLWNSLDKFGDKLLVWLLFGFAIGLFFMICDLYIYRILEGRRFWPEFLWKWKYERMEEYFKNLEKELKKSVNQRERESEELSSADLRKLSMKIIRLADRIREFPPDYSKNTYTGRYPMVPTRFGNVLCEYEYYSLNRYGIHMTVFWNHITQLLSREIKEELKLRFAIADMCVYLCFSSLLYAVVGPAALFCQEETWVMVFDCLIPVKSIVYMLFSIIAFVVLYNISIYQQKSYGRFVKSVFDLYREKLAKELDIKLPKRYHASREELEKEKVLWRKYRRYYFDYDFIDTDNCES